MSTLRRSLLPIILLQLHTLSGGPAAAKVPALIVFGDSTVDTGNNNYISTVIRSDFAPYGRDLRVGGGGQPTGRFSNGRLALRGFRAAAARAGVPGSERRHEQPCDRRLLRLCRRRLRQRHV